jgi:hypothetical protein
MAKDLLKEAIADAKAVREVALQNAKLALEEAFDSKLKSMFSAKLAEELEEEELEEEFDGPEFEDDDEAYMSATDDLGLDDESVLPDSEEYYDLEDFSEGEMYEEEIDLEELMAELASLEEEDDDEYMEEAKKEDKDDKMEEAFDLDALIAEIEAELEEGKDKEDDKMEEAKSDYDKELEEALEEARLKKAKAEKEKEETEKKLKEALDTIFSLKESISEMNLLNSKLLYCNKLFKENHLTDSQKLKIVESLDGASTPKEAKLVYNTLKESFTMSGIEKRSIKEGLGLSSKPVAKQVLTESVDQTILRFQKLANIKP